MQFSSTTLWLTSVGSLAEFSILEEGLPLHSHRRHIHVAVLLETTESIFKFCWMNIFRVKSWPSCSLHSIQTIWSCLQNSAWIIFSSSVHHNHDLFLFLLFRFFDSSFQNGLLPQSILTFFSYLKTLKRFFLVICMCVSMYMSVQVPTEEKRVLVSLSWRYIDGWGYPTCMLCYKLVSSARVIWALKLCTLSPVTSISWFHVCKRPSLKIVYLIF